MSKITAYLMLLIVLSSCRQQPKDELQTCSYNTYKIPLSVGFKNFPVADIDTVIVSYYLPDSTFSNLIIIDTVITPHIYSDGGYEYRDSTQAEGSYFALGTNDMLIYLPSTSIKYYIHVYYVTNDSVIYTQEKQCSGHSLLMSASAIINGQLGQDNGDHANALFLHQ